MKCRCGHGRQLHKPTAKRRAQKRRAGDRGYRVKEPCAAVLPWDGVATRTCPCRDWKPAAGTQDR